MNWWQVDETHDPALSSWVQGADGHHDFPVQNLPFGVFSPPSGSPRIGVAIGPMILDLAACATSGLLPPAVADLCSAATLNGLMAAPAAARTELRQRLSQLLSHPAERASVEGQLHPAQDCRMHLPATIGDYSDFYVGIHHA